MTRRFEGQPEFDEINEHLRIWRIPFGGEEFIRKEDMHDYLGDFVTNALMTIRDRAGSIACRLLALLGRGLGRPEDG